MIDLPSVGSILSIWLAIGMVGFLAWPLAGLLFPRDPDRGYLAAKPIGWLIGAYGGWLAGVAGVPFARFGWIAGLVLLVVVCAVALKQALRHPFPRPLRVLQYEMGFLALLLIGALIKARVPDIHGLEKFMDFAFVNASLRALSMPPADPWWAGAPINYYYFGHTAAAWLIQLSRIPADHGFNVMLGLVFAFVASLSYRLVEGVLRDGNRRVAVLCGGIGALLVTVGGNFHSVLYGPLRAFSPTTYERGFYYPDSTRFVGFDPPTLDRGFTEMPAYGFAVGDLHAHILNLPTAFLLTLVLVRLLQREWENGFARGVRPLEVAILGLLFAVSAMCNSWDAVAYGILMALVGLLLAIRFGLRAPRRALLLLGAGGLVVAASTIMALPFLLEFEPFATHLVWSDGQTPLWQLLVLYGHIAAPATVLFIGTVSFGRRDARWIVGAVLAGLALALVALPEIAYVKDIYGDDHRRANTMFKFSFQAQPIGFLAAIIGVGILLQGRGSRSLVGGLVLAVPMLATLSYAGEIYGHTMRNLERTEFSLNGFGFIDRERAGDRALLDWLRELPAEAPVLLVEAPGDSFGDAGRLSALSGVPALLGWRGHEWLWRGDSANPYERHDEISAFYEHGDLAHACAFVGRHGVTHVAIGTLEREYYPALAEATLRRLGPVVVEKEGSLLIAVAEDRCSS